MPVGWFFSSDDRVIRIRTLIGAADQVSLDDLKALQRDVTIPSAGILRDLLVQRVDRPDALAPAARAVLDALAGWDGAHHEDSAGALALELMVHHLLHALQGPQDVAVYLASWDPWALLRNDLAQADPGRLQPALHAALESAAGDFRRYRRWGGMHRLQLSHLFGRAPWLGRVWRLVDDPVGGGNDSVMKTAHGMARGRHRADLGAVVRHASDLADPDANFFVLLGGQDGWPGSANLLDQYALWRRGDYIRVPLDPAMAPHLRPDHDLRARCDIAARRRVTPMLDHTPLARIPARVRNARLDRMAPAPTQTSQLLRLVRKAVGTRFAKDHGFAAIDSVAAYQERVPVRSYEDFWGQYWRDAFPRIGGATWPADPPYFAESSGTSSGRTKYIPVSREMLRANRRAALDVLAFHLKNRPGSRALGGRNLVLGGSTALTPQGDRSLSGDLSGIAARELPLWARRLYYPPPELALLADWEQKIERLARDSVHKDIRTVGGTTSWLLLFFEALRRLHGRPDGVLADFYPHLEMVVYGGVSFAPYRERFEGWLAGSGAELREVYPASEGFLAIADRGPGEALRLVLDNGLFYEFVPADELGSERPTRHWIGDVARDVNYG